MTQADDQPVSRPRDIAKFVSIYFWVLGYLGLASLIISLVMFMLTQSALWFDFSFIIYLWAGSELGRRNLKARVWTIRLCIVVICLIVLMHVLGVFFGNSEWRVSIGVDIESPEYWQVLVVSALLLMLATIPLVLLLTPAARRQFEYEGFDRDEHGRHGGKARESL
ncbi:MAG: hypothetical protein AAF750_10010 [Planctomycetota bacterium]